MKSGRDLANSKAEARNRKLKSIRARNRVRFVVIVGTIIAVVVGAQLLYNSNLFDLSKVEITGVSKLKKADIVLLSGIKKGDNLLKLDSGGVEKRLRINPWIKSVKISKQLPSTLAIAVTERKPFAVILTKKGFFHIDDEGWVIERLSDGTASTLPKIADIVIDAKPGQKAPSEALANAIACLKGLDPDLQKMIATLSVSTPDKLLLYTRDNVEILYGRAEEVEKKNQVIKAILAQKKGKLIFMDVRTVSNPIVKRLDSALEQ
ncbi:MAG: cell division protein FtsQ/DivIB [Candidatus Aquicultorales bacterium]